MRGGVQTCGSACRDADLDGDGGDMDQDDFAVFQRDYIGER